MSTAVPVRRLKASANALDRTLDKLGSYLLNRPYEEMWRCPASLNLLAHSLGNFMLESVAREPIFIPNVSLFKKSHFSPGRCKQSTA